MSVIGYICIALAMLGVATCLSRIAHLNHSQAPGLRERTYRLVGAAITWSMMMAFLALLDWSIQHPRYAFGRWMAFGTPGSALAMGIVSVIGIFGVGVYAYSFWLRRQQEREEDPDTSCGYIYL